MTISSGSADVVYIKGVASHTGVDPFPGQSYTTDLGYFYEYDGFVNGEPALIRTENPYNEDTLLYGPIYNNKGILTGAEADVNSANLSDGDLTYTIGTDSVVNDVIELGTTHYAYTGDVNVYYITVDGELVERDISDIGYDTDDKVFLRTNDKGLLTDIYVKVVDQPETVNPDAGVLKSVAIRVNGSGNLIADVDLTGPAPAAGMTVEVVVEKYMQATNTWMEVSTKNLTIASGNANGSILMLQKSAMENGEIYRVSASYNEGSVSSSSNLTISGLS